MKKVWYQQNWIPRATRLRYLRNGLVLKIRFELRSVKDWKIVFRSSAILLRSSDGDKSAEPSPYRVVDKVRAVCASWRMLATAPTAVMGSLSSNPHLMS